MASLIAPYTNAMRLGMGFNSYTQELCCNDSVVKANKKPAGEADLTVQDQAVATGDAVESGTMVIPAKAPGETSQIVTWTAKFVDRISEVTDSMNIKGSLAIKFNSIGGQASGSFLDSTKFKTSDLNYFIQVRVVNQRLMAEDVDRFNPIPNTEPGNFNSLYGDSFISGWIEGGEFNAIVSVKLKDNTKEFGVEGKVAAEISMGAFEGKASVEGGVKKNDALKEAETTISVTWSGGGDITPEGIEDWSLENLKKAAVGFPDKVATNPVRTHAILTKYTALRSFHEASNKGSPLDYENAGVYTSALLDAYMDYKGLWTQVQLASWNVDNAKASLAAKESTAELQAYAQEARDHFKAASSSNGFELVEGEKKKVHKALPPNACEPYSASLFGLDKARRDCRYEMIKIVSEVDAVAKDPQVAIDPSRTWQYLSPTVFRMLLPTVTIITEPKVEEPKQLPPPEVPRKALPAPEDIEAKEKEAEEAKAKLDAALKELEAAEQRALPTRPNSRIWIAGIHYGGKAIDSTTVYDRIYDCASKGSRFPVNNDWFEGDPWPGVPKTCAIYYQVDGKGPLRCASGREGTELALSI